MKSTCHDLRRNFPSGNRPQADVALLAHDRTDGVVIDTVQLVGIDPSGSVVLLRPQQFRWAQQAVDVVGAERRPPSGVSTGAGLGGLLGVGHAASSRLGVAVWPAREVGQGHVAPPV